MLTPRRILLMLSGVAGFTCVYIAYALLLGGVDGLPDIPAPLLVAVNDESIPEPKPGAMGPTLLKLAEAFGPNSPEVKDYNSYKTKLDDEKTNMVFSCGDMVFSPTPSPFATVSPFSLAMFAKPKPAAQMAPGEVREISTFHADKAIIQFDRDVTSLQDALKAKMVGLEMKSLPDVPGPDVRKGRIWVTNNQKSADSAQFLVFRTPGPLFYKAAKPGEQLPPDQPHVWTKSAVEVLDLRNMPRRLRNAAPHAAVASAPDDLARRSAVARILLGETAPPPTMTAEGMNIFLQEQDPKDTTKKRSTTGYSGVRAVELCEKVQMNLWSTGGGFPGAGGAAPSPAQLAGGDPPAGAGALVGGLADAAALAQRLDTKTLLVIETLGPFRYDFPTLLARFDAAPAGRPIPNSYVNARRLSARGGQDHLYCQRLDIQFAEPPPPPAGAAPARRAGPAEGGMRVQSLTATGSEVFIDAEAEQLAAQGTSLHYVANPDGTSTTHLKGQPVIAAREQNKLFGGDARTPAEVVIRALPPGPDGRKRSALEVNGPGKALLWDSAARDTTLEATWGKSLTQERDVVGGQEQDLLKFHGGGAFHDRRGNMKLSADQLWLWLGSAAPPPAGAPKAKGDGRVPRRMIATGNVDGSSPELMIRKTDQLTVWFRDAAPPVASAAPPPAPAAPRLGEPTAAATPATPQPPPRVATAEEKPAPEKAKPPMYLSARVIVADVARAPGAAASPGGGKYELERARCEDRVMVHQDPENPAKSPRGLDIFGAKLNLVQAKVEGVTGSVVTVDGGGQWAQVYWEELQLFGPVVTLDQQNNQVAVAGAGRLIMPSAGQLGAGAPGAQPAGKGPQDLDIRWTQEMRFFGARAAAEFLGQVQAVQQPRAGEGPAQRVALRPGGDAPAADETWSRSFVLCHRLDATFDRPVYFNRMKRDGAGGGQPKLRSALCTPMPFDLLSQVRAPEMPIRDAIYLEETFDAAGNCVRAQKVTAGQLDVKVADREQEMYAAGPGEVRILQAGSKSGDPSAQPQTAGDKAPAEREMKLTWVKFQQSMRGRDTARVFQKAVFDGDVTVAQIPSESLHAAVVPEQLPPRGVTLRCTRSLTVTTDRTQRGQPARQGMEAVGNAVFETDDYTGSAARITNDGETTVLEGTPDRLAEMAQKRVNLTQQKALTAERLVHHKDGRVDVHGSNRGSFPTGN